MKKAFIMFVLLGSIITLAGCNSNTDSGAIEYESFTRDAMGISFEKPKEWYEPIDSVNKDDFYIFVVPNQFSAEDKVEGRFQITKVTPIAEGRTLDDAYQVYKDAKVEALDGQVKNFNLVKDAAALTMFGEPAQEVLVQYDSTWGDDTRSVVEVGAVTIHNGSIYIVEYFDEKSDYDKYQPVLENLYLTLKEV